MTRGSDMAMDVAFHGVLGDFTLDAAFRAPAKGVTALFGPSGCGKTSVLRAMAGLSRLAGHCRIGGETWQDGRMFTPPHRRAIGYVFQEASLFPHLSVRGNLLYGAPRGDSDNAARLADVGALLGLASLMDRPVTALSGGERQRVAIGRALLSQPRLMLMDEPLSALDAAARREILPFLERLSRTLALPILYVSHDRGEMERLADHVVLMAAGRVIGAGSLAAVQADTALPLAQEREAGVTLTGQLMCGAAKGLVAVQVRGASLLMPEREGQGPDGPCRVHIPCSDVSVARSRSQDSSILNIVPARIVGRSPLGPHEWLLRLGLGEEGEGEVILARLSAHSLDRLNIGAGDSVFAQVKGVSLLT